MSILEQLGIQTRGSIETMTPFETWEGSSIQQWQVTMQLLTIGDLVDIARFTGDASPLEIAYTTKIYLLAKCIKTINGREVVTAEELENYNKDHNLTGNSAISLFDYKVIHIKKLNEVVVNRLAFMYDEMSNKYVANILGKSVIPDELDATKVKAEDVEETVSDESDGTSTTT